MVIDTGTIKNYQVIFFKLQSTSENLLYKLYYVKFYINICIVYQYLLVINEKLLIAKNQKCLIIF